ncbi:nucleoside 2-deoxyribosyltransferase domain-containing protein [Streptomyces sp. RG80]|uniref:nucleoside 2-deoxyribosyltransferase domain-containing protein n=1 Tax=Streptomyces sp. RG80 TaxID=3157340 RepID=UPI00338EBF0C
MTEAITVVSTGEPVPDSGPRVFLAGPTPHASTGVASWRPAAIEHLAAGWTGQRPLTVLTPETADGTRAAYSEDHANWKTRARAAADAILYWIPRDVFTLPGLTTNVDFGGCDVVQRPRQDAFQRPHLVKIPCRLNVFKWSRGLACSGTTREPLRLRSRPKAGENG